MFKAAINICILFLFSIINQETNSILLKHNLRFKYKLNALSNQAIECSQISYFTQRVDHFSFDKDDEYQQRYILSDKYWQPGNPIFFYTGNEGDIEWFCQNTGFLWKISQEFGALVVFAEHRYYGDSMPYGNKSMDKPYINYLTSEQALADYAYLITSIKNNKTGASNSPVVVFGGSYGGMLSAWFRMKYPNLAVGALAASAPIWQFISDCDSFAKVNTDAFSKADIKCPVVIRSSWSIINDFGKTQKGLDQLTSIFKLCNPLANVDDLKDWIVDIYGNIAMANYPYESNFLSPLPANPVKVMCSNITSTQNTSDPIEVLNGIYMGINVYLNYSGSESLKCFDIDASTISDINMVSWSYQTCTEFVFPTCSNGVSDMFEPNKWDYNQYSKDCFQQFQLTPRMEWPVIFYGGKEIKSFSNIIFSNGDLDPWSGGGVLYNITEKLPAYIINGGAHHLDLRESNPNDPISVIQIRNSEIATIRSWIQDDTRTKLAEFSSKNAINNNEQFF